VLVADAAFQSNSCQEFLGWTTRWFFASPGFFMGAFFGAAFLLFNFAFALWHV
jgi:hypothetical protein